MLHKRIKILKDLRAKGEEVNQTFIVRIRKRIGITIYKVKKAFIRIILVWGEN